MSCMIQGRSTRIISCIQYPFVSCGIQIGQDHFENIIEQGAPPDHYYILELSASYKLGQREHFQCMHHNYFP